MGDAEHRRIQDRLEEWTKNPVFVYLWKTWERAEFDPTVETAELWVTDNSFKIVINPKFWKNCNKYKKVFVVCHEFLHLVFGHHFQIKKKHPVWCNVAQDIQINEFLMKSCVHFGRKKIQDKDCPTVLSVFKNKAKEISTDKTHHYYYDLILKCVR
jgi:predicted metal-dependent peptidase